MLPTRRVQRKRPPSPVGKTTVPLTSNLVSTKHKIELLLEIPGGDGSAPTGAVPKSPPGRLAPLPSAGLRSFGPHSFGSCVPLTSPSLGSGPTGLRGRLRALEAELKELVEANPPVRPHPDALLPWVNFMPLQIVELKCIYGFPFRILCAVPANTMSKLVSFLCVVPEQRFPKRHQLNDRQNRTRVIFQSIIQ